jgi:hypothetical protein
MRTTTLSVLVIHLFVKQNSWFPTKIRTPPHATLRERDYRGDPGVDGKIILKCIFKK